MAYGLSSRPAIATALAALSCVVFTEVLSLSPITDSLLMLFTWHLALNLDSEKQRGEVASATSGTGAAQPSRVRAAWAKIRQHRLAIFRQTMLVFAAWISLTKFSAGMAILIVLLLGSVGLVLRTRRVAWILLIYAGGVLLLWLLAGQRIADLPAWLKNSAEMASGYSGMAIPGPWWQIACYGLAICPMLGVLAWDRWRTRRWNAIPPVLSLAFLCFYVAKSAFVRHDDGHLCIASITALAICLTSVVDVWPRVGQVARGLACASLLPAIILATPFGFENAKPDSWAARLGRAVTGRIDNLAAIGGMVLGRWSPRTQFDAIDAEVRASCPISPGEGSMDEYSYMQYPIFANGAKYDPRPVLQSYAAFTPRLAQMNADHLREAAAPDRILFSLTPMDGHYPSLEDGLSWPELWTRYEVDPARAPFSVMEYLALRRSKESRPWKLVPLSEGTIEIGKASEVPGAAEGPVWVELEFAPTLAGKLAEAAFKGPMVFLDVQLANGATGKFTLLPKLTPAGFLLSPLVADVSWFGWIGSTPWHDPAWQRVLVTRTIRAITVRTSGDWAYNAQVRARFYRLEFEAAHSTVGAFRQRQLALLEMLATPVKPCSPVFRWLNGQGSALVAPGGTLLGVRVSPANQFFALSGTTRRLQIQFGGLRLNRGQGQEGKIEFRIYACDAQGRGRVIWTSSLEADSQPSPTLVHEETLSIDLATTELLVFETVQQRPDQTLIPCWFGITADETPHGGP